jgi:hypothetical protein
LLGVIISVKNKSRTPAKDGEIQAKQQQTSHKRKIQPITNRRKDRTTAKDKLLEQKEQTTRRQQSG